MLQMSSLISQSLSSMHAGVGGDGVERGPVGLVASLKVSHIRASQAHIYPCSCARAQGLSVRFCCIVPRCQNGARSEALFGKETLEVVSYHLPCMTPTPTQPLIKSTFIISVGCDTDGMVVLSIKATQRISCVPFLIYAAIRYDVLSKSAESIVEKESLIISQLLWYTNIGTAGIILT